MRLAKPLQTGLWKSDSHSSLVSIINVGLLLTDHYIISPLLLLHLSDTVWEYDMVLCYI